MQQDKWDKLEYEAMLSPEQRAADKANNMEQARLLLTYLAHTRMSSKTGVCVIVEGPNGEPLMGLAAAASQSTAPNTPETLESNPSEPAD